MLKTREMAYLAPTKGFLQPNPDAAVLFAHFGCTLPPPPFPPFGYCWIWRHEPESLMTHICHPTLWILLNMTSWTWKSHDIYLSSHPLDIAEYDVMNLKVSW